MLALAVILLLILLLVRLIDSQFESLELSHRQESIDNCLRVLNTGTCLVKIFTFLAQRNTKSWFDLVELVDDCILFFVCGKIKLRFKSCVTDVYKLLQSHGSVLFVLSHT